MAVIPAAQVQILYNQGGTDLLALFAVRNVQTGDTLDVTQTGIAPPFTFIRTAVVTGVPSFKAIANAVGTVVTMPSGLPANSSVYLQVGGC